MFQNKKHNFVQKKKCKAFPPSLIIAHYSLFTKFSPLKATMLLLYNLINNIMFYLFVLRMFYD